MAGRGGGKRVAVRKQMYSLSLDPRIVEELDRRVDPEKRNSRSMIANDILWAVLFPMEVSYD